MTEELAEFDKEYGFPQASPASRRLLLETIGATGGAMAGVPLGPATAIAGGGLGYAGFKLLADKLDELQGLKQTPDTLERVAEVGRDFNVGALMQGAGESAVSALQIAYKWAKGLGQKGLTISGEDILLKAKEIFKSNTGKDLAPGPNLAAAKKLSEEIPGYKPSYAEATADPDLIRFQQSLARQPGGMGVEVTHRQSNREALANYLKNEFPGGATIDDVIAQIQKNNAELAGQGKVAASVVERTKTALPTTESQAAGQDIYASIKKAMEPVLKEESELWGKIANYKITPAETTKAFKEALETPSTAQPLLKRLKKVYDAGSSSSNIQWLQGQMEREIDSAIRSQSATQTEKHFLRKIKDAINKDIQNLGSAADRGEIFVSGERFIFPEQLNKEITDLTKQIDTLQKQVIQEPDTIAIIKALMARKVPYGGIPRESKKEYAERLVSQYRQYIGSDVPMLESYLPNHLPTLENTLAAKQTELLNAQPAENVAAQIRIAKNYSLDQKFNRFDKGAIREILQPGNAPNNLKVPDAEIAQRFMKPDNADQLIKAVGPTEAARLMKGFFATDLLSTAQNPLTKELIPKSLSSWVIKNKVVLGKYGILDDFAKLEKAQATLEATKQAQDAFSKSIAAKMLNADPQQAIAAAMGGAKGVSAKNTGEIMGRLIVQVKRNPEAIKGLKNAFKDYIVKTSQETADALTSQGKISNTKIQNIIEKYDPAMRVLYGANSSEYKALRNVQKAVEMSYRSIPSPLGGGSNTVEQANTAFDTLAKVVGMPGLKMGATASFLTRLGQRGLAVLGKMNGDKVMEVLRRAMYDPEIAHDLLLAKSGLAPKVVERRLSAKLIAMGLIGAKEELED